MGRTDEYLYVIMVLQKEKGVARTVDIAKIMDIAPGSVSEMLQRLEAEGYVIYRPYYGVKLTRKGRSMAKKLAEREKILVEFLMFIGLSERKAKSEASRIKHCMSPSTIKKLYLFLRALQEDDMRKNLTTMAGKDVRR